MIQISVNMRSHASTKDIAIGQPPDLKLENIWGF